MTALTEPTVKTISFEEYLAMSGEDSNTEWVNGEIVEMSPESELHQEIGFLLLTAMGGHIQRNRLGKIRFERFVMRLEQIPSAREPDILFVRNENLHRLHPTFLEGPADVVVEIVSLESRLRDRAAKFYEYEQGGVPEYWLIDPDRQTAEFFVMSDRGRYSAHALDADGYFRSRSLDGFRLKPSWLWEDPLPDMFTLAGLVSDDLPD